MVRLPRKLACYAAEVSFREHALRFAPFALAAVGGLSVGFSGEPWSYNVLAFVGLACLAQALSTAQTGARPHRASLLLGLTFGSVANAIALGSVVDLLEQFGHFPGYFSWPTASLCWLAQGLPYAACGLVTSLAAKRAVPLSLSFPLALTLSLTLVPQLFPWHVGATQVDFLWFAQIADLGGEAALNLMLAFAAIGLWNLVRRDSPNRARAGLLLALSVLAPCAYGVLRLDQIRAARAVAESVRIGVAQPNVDIDQKHDPLLSGKILENLRDLTRRLELSGADLTVWPETAYPYQLLRARRTAPVDHRAILSERVHGPVVMGLVSYERDPRFKERRYNSAWLVRADNTLGGRVDKTRLLAFGEYVPFWELLPPLQKRFASPGFGRGVPDVISVDGAQLGIMICYEDLFFEQARGVVARGAQVLVNMTNVAWFGRSHVPLLHDMMAHLRAIETRRDFVRSVNTGRSSFTLATGETTIKTTIFTRQSFVAVARKLDLQTVYVRAGDLISPLCALVLLWLSSVRKPRPEVVR